MSDPQGERPHPDHPQQDDFELESLSEERGAIPPGHKGDAAEVENPLDALGLNASSDDFQFTGPMEELDFSEPADFTFPTDQPAETAAVSHSAADHSAAEHVFGAEARLTKRRLARK